ncbi:MAG: hypothetical protein G8D61_01720 [gamma proteobacterium symbiont of Ctena orbiculata]|nr:hypothetical protein [Candidatus Thiodiazotropha sp. (ex Lucina pensylvanica)]MBV2094823.1 hypothetical protein [Candidatus Thiodiazotropha sp. (ex Codakia orbicularis)]PUB71935.1 MAG: hypothetical protein DBP03_19545 [gamma proteobacterium symbiont of Ctena orbiculata]PUB75860.1 MAG: hypothetical protein DBO99_15420 [gamma proteobacterium symbiont of Ctena orbiculata]
MDTRTFRHPAAVLLVTLFTGFSTPLYAIDYSFVEGRFLLDAEFDDVDDDGDGFRFAGSFQVTNEIFAFAKYDDVELDDSDVDFSLLRIGAGYIHPLDASWDANVSLAYADAEADGPGGEEDESGFELSGGVRGMVKPQIEVRASLNYLDIEDSDTYFTLGGDYYIMPNISAGIELDMGGDYETVSIGAKFYF